MRPPRHSGGVGPGGLISVFDLFSIGIGPSSSHTVGPMRAARSFAEELSARGVLADTARLEVHLYGSLAATGRAHGTHEALLLGLVGERPELVDPETIGPRVAAIRAARELALFGTQRVAFFEATDLVRHGRERPRLHPNAMTFVAWDRGGAELARTTAYSIGGGFVLTGPGVGEEATAGALVGAPARPQPPHPFSSATELLGWCESMDATPAEVMLANESAWQSAETVRARLAEIWAVMRASIERGLAREGVLPGPLRLRRRAAATYRSLTEHRSGAAPADLSAMSWLDCCALAVSEENAAGGRVVTAPTNGAAGIIPSVLHYYEHAVPGADQHGVVTFLLTAGAIGILCKTNASISGAEVGCQGEVGSACAMAAAGLCAVLGGTARQIENAAEIGIEHNLGLTCDPVGGLVQIPCIERNAMAAVKAVNAATMALDGDGTHRVSLDQALATMRATGADMKTKYKETARGGLALSVPEC
ncbi:MAG: L-serine ammonia-lyase [Actinomycetota bacterium]|nr:L-serine ammonia-lyase [Actinomycetota bacterium]